VLLELSIDGAMPPAAQSDLPSAKSSQVTRECRQLANQGLALCMHLIQYADGWTILQP